MWPRDAEAPSTAICSGTWAAKPTAQSEKSAVFLVLPLPRHLLRVPLAWYSPWLLSWRSRARSGGPCHRTGWEHPKPWGFFPWKPGAGLKPQCGGWAWQEATESS